MEPLKLGGKSPSGAYLVFACNSSIARYANQEMKLRSKASERAVAVQRLLGLVVEEDQESGLEFNILALSVRADALFPRPLLFCLNIPSIPIPMDR